jgi:RNA polymerase sigma factor (sigma-70 family)
MKDIVRQLRRTERRRLYDLLADHELLTRFLQFREESAFEELVSRHGPMVRAVCRRVLGPTADADDAFQAAFLILLRKARSIRRTDLLANWLCAVAYRTSRQALRRRSRIGARERTGTDLPEPARPDDPPRDWLPLFDAALQRLPAKYREPVVLCELQGLTRPEAARHLGLNEGTLSSRLGRGRDLLRRKLCRHGFPLSIGAALAPAVVPEALTASTAAAGVSVSAASVTAIVLTEGVLAAMFATKLKAGAACTAVLIAGAIAGFQLAGPKTLASGPDTTGKSAGSEPTKDRTPPPPAKGVADTRPEVGPAPSLGVSPPSDSSTRVDNGTRVVEHKNPFPAKVAYDERRTMGAKNADLSVVIGAWELVDVDGQPATAATPKVDLNPEAGPMPPRAHRRWEVMRRLYLLPSAPASLVYASLPPICIAHIDLDATKSPKWITLMIRTPDADDAPAKHMDVVRQRRICGIYKMDGEQLVLCLPEAEASPLLRPTEFKGDGEGGLYVLTYKRPAGPWVEPPAAAPIAADFAVPKSASPEIRLDPGVPIPPMPLAPPVNNPPTSPVGPAAPAADLPPVVPSSPPVAANADSFTLPVPTTPTLAPTPSDLERLQGAWVPVQADGKPVSGAGADDSMEIVKDRVLTSDGRHGRFRLDESKSPRQIRFEMPGESKGPNTGIYKLEGDRLTIASHNRSANLVPIKFESNAEDGIRVVVYERVKGEVPPPTRREPPRVPAASDTTLPSSPPLNDAPKLEPPRPTERDLHKELDQLREQLKRLEKLLQDRKPGEPPPISHWN